MGLASPLSYSGETAFKPQPEEYLYQEDEAPADAIDENFVSPARPFQPYGDEESKDHMQAAAQFPQPNFGSQFASFHPAAGVHFSPPPPPPQPSYHQYPPGPYPVQYPRPPPSPLTYQQPPSPYVQFPPPPGGQVNLVAAGIPAIGSEKWSTELFDCMSDPDNAIITALCPCVTFGQIAEIVDKGQTSCATSGMIYGAIACCIAMPCLISCSYRTKLRSQFRLKESPAPDWLTHCCCECCALCQEYRELRRRGFDPSIGWIGNVSKQQQQQLKVQGSMSMVPPGNQVMMMA
ncbi:protein PLANT CADMIUM RESISTANCE 4-like [Diospyros lotus]|uniref:protein PLANT CADMIUM RESISTANCE 4-like n=1 Tax=Diospyros lotus TaxID=55363 RepID=UPI002254B282|nr:protein PLANT CADMIUM RESISTANCE 4-like [Diospyros lotus]